MGLKWAYGVTTVPERRSTLLPRTLASLRRGGFENPRLFVDGDNDAESWEQEFGLRVTTHFPSVRTFGNWMLALWELYIREPKADRYAIFQDDLVTYVNLRQYLEASTAKPQVAEVQPPQGRQRNRFAHKSQRNAAQVYWNLYSFPSNEKLATGPGWHMSNQRGLGALALVFPRAAVIALLSSEHMADRPQSANRGYRNVDGGIVTALAKAQYSEVVHSPTLVMHTGIQSSMGSKFHELATTFRGEHFDAMELFDGSQSIGGSGRPGGESSADGGDNIGTGGSVVEEAVPMQGAQGEAEQAGSLGDGDPEGQES
jgi:hypothetical protein